MSFLRPSRHATLIGAMEVVHVPPALGIVVYHNNTDRTRPKPMLEGVSRVGRDDVSRPSP